MTKHDIQKMLQHEVENKMISIRGEYVLLDADVAALYGVETRRLNEAVRRNIEKFPEGYIYHLDNKEVTNLMSQFATSSLEPIDIECEVVDSQQITNNEQVTILRSQNVTSNWGGTRKPPIVFTEKGLYMLATVLRSERATAATFAIIETFVAVRSLKRDLTDLHRENNKKEQQTKIERFGKKLTEIVMPDLETTETESTLEINFIVGKITHTVKRTKKQSPNRPSTHKMGRNGA